MLPGFNPRGAGMRYKIGAEQLELVPSLAHRPDGTFRSARIAPVGPTHAVDAATEAVACGIKADGLDVLDQDWKEAFLSRSALAVLRPWSPRARRGVTGASGRGSPLARSPVAASRGCRA
jgi:hypothetical protein